MTVINDIYNKLMSCTRQFQNQFTTVDVIEIFKRRYPPDWNALQQRYGRGGRGCGRRFTPNNYIALRLKYMSKIGMIRHEGFERAPKGWGKPCDCQMEQKLSNLTN